MTKAPALFRLSFLFGIFFIFTFVISDYTSSQSKSEVDNLFVKNGNQQKSVVDPTPTPHNLVGSFYTLAYNTDAKLMLNNKGNTQLEVQPTLYNKQGQELQLPSVTVESQSFRFINLADWAAIGGESYKTGNIKLFHTGKDLVLGAQIYLTQEAYSLGFEEKLAELGKFDSRRQEAVWVMPTQQTKAEVILTNTTDASLSVTAKLAKNPNTVGAPQTFELAAHETKILDLRQDFVNGNQFANSTIVGLSLEHTGAQDALLARVMVGDIAKGYSNVVQFSNPAGGKSSEYQGVGFQIEDVAGQHLIPVIVARNVGTTAATITARVPYTRIDGTRGTITLPQKQLAAGELGLINTQSIVTRVQKEQIKVASLEVEYNTAPGNVIVATHSVSTDGNQVFRVPMWDPVGQRSPTGGYPWRIEGTSVTETYIKNIADYEEDYVAFLVWENGGMYMLGLKPIAGHETVHIDVKKLRDEQIPDEKGRTIPLFVSSGQLQWTLRRKDNLPDDDSRANLALIGRSEQVDIAKGITNNYSCQNCCSGTHSYGFIFPTSQVIEYGQTAHYIAVEAQETCYGFPYEFNIGANWSSSNSGLGTISGGDITGQGVGQSNIGASWSAYRAVVYPCPPGGGGFSLFGFQDETAENCSGDKIKRGGPSLFESKNNAANFNLLIPPCGACQYHNFTFTPPVATLTVKPIVGSLTAKIRQSNTEPNSGQETSFTTFNNNLAFATNSSDLFVGFKGGYDINVTAEDVVPATAEASLKWEIERDPLDAQGQGTDTGNPAWRFTPKGTFAPINPTKAGNFHLIAWYDANGNNSRDAGEELKVLKFAIAKASIVNESECNMKTLVGFTHNSGLGEEDIFTSNIEGDCKINLKTGGADKSVGLDLVKIGPVANLFSFYDNPNSNSRNLEVLYDSPPNNPMLVPKLTDVAPADPQMPVSYPTLVFRNPVAPIDGDGIFRNGRNIFPPTAGSTGGKDFRFTFSADTLPLTFSMPHPGMHTTWKSTAGIPRYGDLIVGYVDGLNKTYVVFAKMEWQVSFAGEPDKQQRWKPNLANIYLNGTTGYSGDFITKSYDSTIGADGSVKVVGNVDLYSTAPMLNAALYPSQQNFDTSSYKQVWTPEEITVDDLVILPNAQVNVPYSAINKICAAEGAPPYTWVINNAPVPGLTLSSTGTPCATLSGTPTAAGSYSLVIQGTDSANISSTGRYSLRVNP